MASPENAEGDRVDPEKKEDTGPSFVETVLPIPDFFYDVRATLPLIGASPGKVRTLTNVIYLVTIGVFCRDICILFAPRATSQRRDSHLV